MHGIDEQDEIAYWRERAEKTERAEKHLRYFEICDEALLDITKRLEEQTEEYPLIHSIIDDTLMNIRQLVSQRDEARKLAADTAHQLANERQVVADLRDANELLCEQVAELNAGCVAYECVAAGVIDIGMRYLVPPELARAQGFASSYVFDRAADGSPIGVTEQVRLIGNSVPPVLAEHVVRAQMEAL